MPSVNFSVTWPDGEQATYYSPSTIVFDYLAAGTEYSLAEFAEQSRAALTAASERVFQRFGYYCSAASGELEKIDLKLKFLHAKNIAGPVQVTQLR
jgi:uncharacterized repeat protein (TIGR04042 family)